MHAVPVGVELAADLLDDGARQRDVEIGEVRLVGGTEILVADVAAADDRDAVVRDPRLVVHAAVQMLPRIRNSELFGSSPLRL